jgi:hypothetical protein
MIGDCWEQTSWETNAWEANTWEYSDGAVTTGFDHNWHESIGYSGNMEFKFGSKRDRIKVGG